MGEEKEKVSACENVPRSGSSVVRFRNVKGFFFGEMVCFLHDALESRVHFERLGDGLAALGSEIV